MPTIEETIAFIQQAHAGQVDAQGVTYYLHPIAVMNLLPNAAPLSVKLAALLHDVLEDTPYTRADLEQRGYDAETLDIVELVTWQPDDRRSFDDKIDALIAAGNHGALMVKRADMTHNSDPVRMQTLSEECRQHFSTKYLPSLHKINAILQDQ